MLLAISLIFQSCLMTNKFRFLLSSFFVTPLKVTSGKKTTQKSHRDTAFVLESLFFVKEISARVILNKNFVE